MATYQYYGVGSVRGIISILSGLGVVCPTQPTPLVGGTSPYSYSIGANTYQFYSGPAGGPHPGWAGGLGVAGDYMAWDGFRCATAFSPPVWTAFSADPDFDVDSPANYGTSATKAYLHCLHARTSVDGSSFDYQCVLIVAHYSAGLGSWNYKVTVGGGALSGGVAVDGISLSAANIQALAEAIAAMIQIVNNVTVGTDLIGALSSIQTSLELLNTALGADGFADSFDAAMDLLIDKFGTTGPFATLQADLQAIRDNLGTSSPINDLVSQMTEALALLGAGGLLGALSAGGSIPAALANLSPIMGAIQSIGSVANAIAQFQQSSELANIANAANNVAGNVANLSNATSQGFGDLNSSIFEPGFGNLGNQIQSAIASLTSAISTVSVRLSSIDSRLVATIGSVEYDVVEAIAQFSGGGGGGGSVDLSPLVSKLEEIRVAIGSGSITFDMERLKEILDGYFTTTQGGETFNLAYLIISLLNTGWIIYK